MFKYRLSESLRTISLIEVEPAKYGGLKRKDDKSTSWGIDTNFLFDTYEEAHIKRLELLHNKLMSICLQDIIGEK